jgi:hypothetical protein
MTRKRFIKLFMALGLQKREAQKLALRVHANNVPYKEAFFNFVFARLERGLEELCVSVHKFTEGILKLSRTLCEVGEGLREDGRKITDNLTECLNGRAEGERN